MLLYLLRLLKPFVACCSILISTKFHLYIVLWPLLPPINMGNVSVWVPSQQSSNWETVLLIHADRFLFVWDHARPLVKNVKSWSSKLKSRAVKPRLQKKSSKRCRLALDLIKTRHLLKYLCQQVFATDLNTGGHLWAVSDADLQRSLRNA